MAVHEGALALTNRCAVHQCRLGAHCRMSGILGDEVVANPSRRPLL